MTSKVNILEELGETVVLLPQVINRALAANDGVKYFLTLFQSARSHSDHPQAEAPSLQQEREVSGVSDASLDTVVGSTFRDGSNLFIPQASRLHTSVTDCIGEMMLPLRIVASSDTTEKSTYDRLQARFERLKAAAPSLEHDRVPVEYIDAMTRGRSQEADSFHALVMDLHRELNRLQRGIATESLDGANVYAVAENDRALVVAFMAGVNRTAPLKFDHPGLSTSATRAGDRLTIQNDIGTTDSHVLVLHVVGLTLAITYTDVHRARLQFFKSLLEPAGFEWTSNPSQHSDASYHLAVGRLTAHDDEELRRDLTLVGSRIVFLIDWNRARKRLSRFVKKSDAIEILKWAADHDIGHRAFLQMGDVRLVYTAMERAARAPIRFGARLDEILGRESACTFLQAVLLIASEGLRDHKSAGLIQDETHAELLRHFQTGEQSALALAADHGMLVAALTGLVRDALVRSGAASLATELTEIAARAKVWESRADHIVRRFRTGLETSDGAALTRLVSEADDVADGLEEATFLATLVPEAQGVHAGLEALRQLADLMTIGAQDYVKCLECARDLQHLETRDDVEAFLVAVDAVVEFEHRSDEQERAVTATLVHVARDFRELHVLSAIAGRLGDAADALTRCALILRDYVLETLNTR